MRIIDTHGHVQMIRSENFGMKSSLLSRWQDKVGKLRSRLPEEINEFLTDEEVAAFADMVERGLVAVVSPATELSDIALTLEFGKKVPGVFAAIGVHPLSEDDWRESAEAVKKAIKTNRDVSHVVAIGEIGLDFSRGRNRVNPQVSLLKAQFELALEEDLPVILHTRESNEEILKIVDEFPGVRGVFHFFTGPMDFYREIRKRGFFVGVGELLTYPEKSKDRVRESVFSISPEERHYVVVETDSPFVAPVPFRGEKNYPGYVRFSLEKLAEGWRMLPEDCADLTTRNAIALFGLYGLEEDWNLKKLFSKG